MIILSHIQNIFKIYCYKHIIVTYSPLWNITWLLLGSEMIEICRYILRMIKKHHPHVDRLPYYFRNCHYRFLTTTLAASWAYVYIRSNSPEFFSSLPSGSFPSVHLPVSFSAYNFHPVRIRHFHLWSTFYSFLISLKYLLTIKYARFS